MPCYRISPTLKRIIPKVFLTLFALTLLSRITGMAFAPAESGTLSGVFIPQELSPSGFQVAARSSVTLGKGKFLVASRELNDPNFSESVILLLDYNENGALGVVINRPTEIPLTKLLPQVKALQKRKDIVHIGGPVARDMMLLLTQTTQPPQDAHKVLADIYLLSQQSELEHVLQSNGKHTKLRAFVGYAGWAAGQLDMEVTRGGWLIVPADPMLIFNKAPADIWPELIRRGEAQWTCGANCGLRMVD